MDSPFTCLIVAHDARLDRRPSECLCIAILFVSRSPPPRLRPRPCTQPTAPQHGYVFSHGPCERRDHMRPLRQRPARFYLGCSVLAVIYPAAICCTHCCMDGGRSKPVPVPASIPSAINPSVYPSIYALSSQSSHALHCTMRRCTRGASSCTHAQTTHFHCPRLGRWGRE